MARLGHQSLINKVCPGRERRRDVVGGAPTPDASSPVEHQRRSSDAERQSVARPTLSCRSVQLRAHLPSPPPAPGDLHLYQVNDLPGTSLAGFKTRNPDIEFDSQNTHFARTCRLQVRQNALRLRQFALRITVVRASQPGQVTARFD